MEQTLAEKVSVSSRRIRQYAANYAQGLTRAMMAGQNVSSEKELLRWLLCNLEALNLPANAGVSAEQKWEIIGHICLYAPIHDHSLSAYTLFEAADVYDVKLVHWDEVLDKPDLIERPEFERRLLELKTKAGASELAGPLDFGGAIPTNKISLAS